jgi:hypothetical protein
MREEERRLRNKKYFLLRHFSICWLGAASFSSLLYPAHETAASKPVQSKTGSLAIFGILGFLRGVGARLRQPGRARLILLPSADSLLTRLGSGIRTLTHVRRTGPARADGRNCESGTLTGTMYWRRWFRRPPRKTFLDVEYTSTSTVHRLIYAQRQTSNVLVR